MSDEINEYRAKKIVSICKKIRKEVAESSFAAPAGSDAGVESETCPDCDRGYVPAWDGEGNEIGEQPCHRCGGTGSIEKAKPQPNDGDKARAE